MKIYLVFHGTWFEDTQKVKKVFVNKGDAEKWLDLYLDDVKGIHWIEEHDIDFGGL